MAYRRYGKRSYKKRSYRGRKLSSRRVYRHRSSRAQAGQIVALNKKINRVKKELAPDIEYFDCNMRSLSIPKSNLVNCFKSSVLLRSYEGHPNGDFAANSETTLGGYWASLQAGANTVNIKNLRFRLSLSKGNSTGYGYIGPLKLEFIVVQCTSQPPASAPIYDQIFGAQPSNLGAHYIGYPLNAGFWKRFRILSRKFINMENDTVLQKDINFNVKPKWHKLVDMPNSLGDDFSKQGDIYCVYRVWGNSADEGAIATFQYSVRIYFTHA